MNNEQQRAFVSISEMAAMLNLSRTRFYLLLQAGVFPQPSKSPYCGRRYFDLEGQRRCLEIKRSNQSVDGSPVFFYKKSEKRTPKNIPAKQKENKYDWIVEALTALGVENINHKSIEAAIKVNFTDGITHVAEETIVRTLYIEFSH